MTVRTGPLQLRLERGGLRSINDPNGYGWSGGDWVRWIYIMFASAWTLTLTLALALTLTLTKPYPLRLQLEVCD